MPPTISRAVSLAGKVSAPLTLLLVLPLCYLRLAVGSGNYGFHADELRGIAESHDLSYGSLLRMGPIGELNPSPLHYLIDKTLLLLSGPGPQLRWETRFFFRILPMLWWTLAAGAIFLGLLHLLRRRGLPGWIAWLLGLGGALFTFSKAYLVFYATQDRPYSLWVSLSFLHLVLFLRAFLPGEEESAFHRKAYVAVSWLATLTTYVSALQVAVAGAAYFLFGGPAASPARRRAQLWSLGGSCVIALFYFRSVLQSSYENQAADTFASIKEMLIIAASPVLDTNSYAATMTGNWDASPNIVRAWCLFAVLMPLVFWRRKEARSPLFLCYSLFAISLPIAVGLRWRGYPVGGTRYFIFLVPYLSALAAWTTFALAETIAKLCPSPSWRRHARSSLALLLAAGLIHAAVARNRSDLETSLSRNPKLLDTIKPMKEPRAGCPADIVSSRGEGELFYLEQFHALCR